MPAVTVSWLIGFQADCGKQKIHGHKAVRQATKPEIMEYIQIQKELQEDADLYVARKEANHENHSYCSHRADLRQSHIGL